MQEPGPNSINASAHNTFLRPCHCPRHRCDHRPCRRPSHRPFHRKGPLLWAIAAALISPGPVFAQAQISSTLSISDMVSILLLFAFGVAIWQWQAQRRDLKDARRLLYRLFEIQTAHTPHSTQTGAPEPSLLPTTAPELAPALPLPSPPSVPPPALQEPLELYAARVERLQAALEQALERLQALQQAQETANARLLEVHSLLPEGANVSKIMQRFQKDTAAGLERIQVTQAGLVSALDALHATERRDLTLLETLGTDLATQLGEIQADLGLVLKARPVRGAGRAQSPYDVALAAEYYANLQKLMRAMIKNEKASTYALEGVQYLYESLQVQSSLTTLLSNSEFAIRLTPRVLDENIVQPIVTQLREGAQADTAQREKRREPSQHATALPSPDLRSDLTENGKPVSLDVALEGSESPETDLELPQFLLREKAYSGTAFPGPP